MKRWDNWVALILASIGIVGWIYWSDVTRTAEEAKKSEERAAQEAAFIAAPAEDWFVVHRITIPDYETGLDPLMNYDREVRKSFSSTWNVEIHLIGGETDYAVCTGSGTNYYEPKETLPEAGVLLSWFVGRDCKLPVGQYLAKVSYEIRPLGYPTKQLVTSSNNFHVIPQGAKIYITPEQSKKMEEIK